MLIWFIRLRLPKKYEKEYPILVGNGLIRELHVYGYNTAVGDKAKASQHRGIGSKLLRKAEIITWIHNYNGIVVISGEGVKEYYKKKGYIEKDTFMIKKFYIRFYNLLTILFSVFVCILGIYFYFGINGIKIFKRTLATLTRT